MLSIDTADPVIAVESIRAAADVQFVDEAPGFLASVMLVPGYTPLARLAFALIGSLDEGRVLREVMLTTAGASGSGLFLWLVGS